MPTTSTFTTRDGCAIEWRRFPARTAGAGGGSPETLVLLHGWSQSQAMFDRVAPLLAEERDVVTFDMRNHGLSGRTERGARIASLAADLAELLDHLGDERFHLLGHSMGASILWSYLDGHGSARVRSVAFVDQPSVVAVLPWMDPAEAPEVGAILDFAGLEGFCKVLLGPDGPTARRDFLRTMLTPDIPDADYEWLAEQNLLLPMPWGSRLLQDHALQDWRDVLPDVDVPAFVVGGEVSHVAPSSQEWIARQVPGARLVVFPREQGGAHFAFFEAPAVFAEAYGAFLADVSGRVTAA
ncbi:MAG: alpha/beta hydrolase [Nocardioides alkalitolerans]